MLDVKPLSIQEAKDYAKKRAILLANRWQHRRRMAYIALVSIIALTYTLLFHISPEKIKALETVVTWYYITMGSIIGAYVGFATLDDKWKKDTKEGEQ